MNKKILFIFSIIVFIFHFKPAFGKDLFFDDVENNTQIADKIISIGKEDGVLGLFVFAIDTFDKYELRVDRVGYLACKMAWFSLVLCREMLNQNEDNFTKQEFDQYQEDIKKVLYIMGNHYCWTEEETQKNYMRTILFINSRWTDD